MPIIAGRTGGVPALVKNENGILVEPGNVEDINNAIAKMKDSIEMRINMGKENRKRVVKYYCWKSVAQQYLNYYENMT